MLWLPRNEKGVITGKGAERRMKEFSCSSEQNKTCKEASFLPKCPEGANVLEAQVSSSVSLARNSSSHVPTAGPLAKGSKLALGCVSTSLHLPGQVPRHGSCQSRKKKNNWKLWASVSKSWDLPAGELTMWLFSAPFLLDLRQPSPMRERAW